VPGIDRPRWATSPQFALGLTVFFVAMAGLAVFALATEDGEWDNWVFLLAMLFNAAIWALSYERRR
jgi:hypothetical protein